MFKWWLLDFYSRHENTSGHGIWPYNPWRCLQAPCSMCKFPGLTIDSIFDYNKDWSTIIKAINHIYFPCGVINHLPLKHKQLRTQEHPLKTSKTGKGSGIQATWRSFPSPDPQLQALCLIKAAAGVYEQLSVGKRWPLVDSSREAWSSFFPGGWVKFL